MIARYASSKAFGVLQITATLAMSAIGRTLPSQIVLAFLRVLSSDLTSTYSALHCPVPFVTFVTNSSKLFFAS